MTIETKDIVSIYRLGSKSDSDPKNRPILVKFVNTSLKLKLIKNAFHLKNNGCSIWQNHRRRNSYKAFLNQKKELEKKEMSVEWEFKIRGPPWDQKIIKIKKKQCWLCQQKIRKSY